MAALKPSVKMMNSLQQHTLCTPTSGVRGNMCDNLTASFQGREVVFDSLRLNNFLVSLFQNYTLIKFDACQCSLLLLHFFNKDQSLEYSIAYAVAESGFLSRRFEKIRKCVTWDVNLYVKGFKILYILNNIDFYPIYN